MGPMELMVILVLALIIFGPGKLPEIAGQVGRVVRDFRRTTAELSSEFNRTLSLEIEERKSTGTDTVPPPAPPAAEYESYAAAPAEAAPVAAVEPSEAPPVIAPPVSPVIETPAPEPVPVAAPVASKRRTIDEDLAPPY
jgi:TatA/E family protein of Tat protein translocase